MNRKNHMQEIYACKEYLHNFYCHLNPLLHIYVFDRSLLMQDDVEQSLQICVDILEWCFPERTFWTMEAISEDLRI